MTTSDLSHLASALDNLANALWLMAESQYNQLQAISTQLGAEVTAVQVQQEDLDQLASDLEAVKGVLASEISTLENEHNIPAGSLDGLKQALSDLSGLEPPAPSPAPAQAEAPQPDGVTDSSE